MNRLSLLFFILGAGAALCSGVAMQEVYNNFQPALRFKEKYWLRVEMRRRRSTRLENRMERHMKRRSRAMILPPALGWMSGLLWLAGAASLALRQ